jgi:sulfate permease, SulP family
VPIAGWLRGYRAAWLSVDLLAGAATAAVVIPQAMAYAGVAGLPVQHGLYCALVPIALYALSGTSRPLSVSTTSTISLLTAAAIATAPPGSHPAQVASLLALEVGAILFVAGVLRLGFASDFISRPVLVGFKIGMGLAIAASQLGKVLGVDVEGETFFPKVLSALGQLGEVNLPTVALATGVVVALIVIRRLAPGLRGPLLVLVGATLVMGLTNLDARGVATVAPVPPGLPALDAPPLGLAGSLLPSAAGIALIAFVESIAAARAFRRADDAPVDPDRELVALGVANVGGGLFRAFPAGGGLSQTAVNERAGARTQLAEIATASLVALVLIALAPLVRYIPEAALGGIVLVAAAGLLSREEAQAIRRLRVRDWAFTMLTLAAVLVLGTLQGILVGVVVSLLTLFWDLNHPPLILLARKPGTDMFRSAAEHPDDERIPGLLILRVESPLYFGNAQRVIDRIALHVHESDPPPRVSLLAGSAVSDADTTAAAVLAERTDRLEMAGTEVWLAALTGRVLDMVRRSPRWTNLEARGRVHPTVVSAVEAYLRQT